MNHQPGTEPDGEASYANCLLTTLSKVLPRPVTLHPGRGVPALMPFATTEEEQRWIAGLPFRYEELDAGKVIALLLLHAGYRFYHFRPRRYELAATLVTPAGQQQVRFAIQRGGGLPVGPITVTRLP